MKAIVIGSGTIGSAVRKALEEKGHEVVSVGRKSGDYQADIFPSRESEGALQSDWLLRCRGQRCGRRVLRGSRREHR
jgi:nucleoside-diphosphate-sugar epimerase